MSGGTARRHCHQPSTACHSGTAIFPVDPAGPGTWVGVNDAEPRRRAAQSKRRFDRAARQESATQPRAHHLRICSSVRRWRTLSMRGAAVDPRDFDRFRLAIAQRGTVATLTSDGAELAVEVTELARPMMLTSSSLGDALVERPRRRLFERVFAGEERSWVQAQSLFHRHQWRSRRDISVRMERADATTVSQTFVSVMGSAIELRYRALESRGVRCGHGESDMLTFLSLMFGTLVSEDLACVTAGLLIQRGQVEASSAVLACTLGIFAGDVGLWAIGRACGRTVLAWPRVARRFQPDRFHEFRSWLERHAGWAIVASRFLPGSRLPLYVIAGIVRVARHRVRWLGSAWNTALDTSACATDGDHWRCVHRADFESDRIGLDV